MRSSLGVFRSRVLLALGLSLGASLAVTACGGDSDGDTPTTFRPCTGSTPVPGNPSLETCNEGFVHRVSAASCSSSLPRPDVCDAPNPGTTPECTTDNDCTASPHGICGVSGQIFECTCRYGCVTDNDCDTGQVCSCGSPAGTCVNAACTSNAECGAGLCVQTRLTKCSSASGFACQLPSDECTTDAECQSGQQCTLTDVGRKCLQDDCPVPGRPFLVADEPRVAGVVERDDWLADDMPELTGLSPAQRAALADYWQRAGQMEHASIAAFARFALQLSSLGAPPELFEETAQAMLDETRHAKLCFAFASAYGGRALGPTTLTTADALAPTELHDIVRLTFLEGCVGETCAAHEARQMAAAAADPVVKRALAAIADDEERHALTAWKFIAWARYEFGAEVAETVARVAEELQRTSQAPASSSATATILDPSVVLEPIARDVPSEAERLALRAEVLQLVVLPCTRSWLDAGRDSEVDPELPAPARVDPA